MTCPNCHDTHVRTTAIVAALDQTFVKHQCANCGKEWSVVAPARTLVTL